MEQAGYDECVVCDEWTEHCPHGKCLLCEGCGKCFPVNEEQAPDSRLKPDTLYKT